ncbi:hypothetical protein GDO86_015178 [Hymenochirus boettgeri]|uniref:Uncharacterized protein n=1 Tax=Hymenochirus boettgeri TaxID=247094 RepID=A0A8T2JUF7_9PIPI|nr:hypothetical protein GDO86_015178 [Hymenochirus boettgeri]
MDALYVSLLFFLGLVSGDPSGCIIVNNCKCLMKDGTGVINLAALGDSEGFLVRNMMVQRDTETEESITFSPCHPFSEPDALVNCSHVAVCVVTRNLLSPWHAPLYTGYGQHEGNEFIYSNESKILSVTYQAVPGSHFRTIVHFNCSLTSSITFPSHTDSPDTLEMFVHSPCVCPGKCQAQDVGPGTIILIMFAMSFILYLIFGTCSLRSIETSEGIQITPEPHIWCWTCFQWRRPREPRKTFFTRF